jgi:hypothetical protein
MPAKAGMIAKVVKPTTVCREANFSRDTVNIRDDSSSRDIRNITDVSSSRSNRIRQYRKVSMTMKKTAKFSRDASSRSRISQLEH